jgi:putative ABC transport system permease protein
VIGDVVRDVRYAVRSLRRTPGFTSAAVITLALGIGANTAMFSVADATAFRPPDVGHPADVVRVFTTSREIPYSEVSYPDYLDFKARTTTLSGLAAYETSDFSLAVDRRNSAQYVGGLSVSANFFSVLETPMTLGRGFTADDDRLSSPVAIVSHRLWERAFLRNPAVVGTRVSLSGTEFTIVGVAPEPFGTELFFHPDVFIPLAAIRLASPTLQANVLEDRSRGWLTVLGRLRPRTNATQASAEFAALARDLELAYPDANRRRRALVLPEVAARAQLDSGGAQGAIAFVAIVGLVLLLACANVANLLLSRGASRSRELALRAAVGASRWQLIRQLLLETAVLSACGTVTGLLIAAATLSYLSTLLIIPSALPLSIDLRLDARALVVTGLAALITCALCGLAPAVSVLRVAIGDRLKPTSGSRVGRLRPTLRTGLVVLQVALSVVLLVASGVLIRAFLVAQRVDPGFRTDHVLLASFNPALVRYDTARGRQFYDQLVERVRALPGVSAVGLTRYVPLGVTSGSMSVAIESAGAVDGRNRVDVAETSVDTGYWNVVRAAIIRGRVFDATDTASAPPVAIVNETFARRFWPGQDPIGKTIAFPDVPGANGTRGQTAQVVGIAQDGKYLQLAEAAQPFVYRPIAQGRRVSLTMMLLATGEPSALASALRAAVQSVDPAVPTFDVRTFDDLYRSRALLPARTMSQVVTALGVLAVLLSSVGLYGVIAFLTMRRTSEIGVRMAVGATPGRVLRLVLRQAATFVLPGVGLGTVAAFLLVPLLASPAFDFVTPRDPWVFAWVVLLTSGLALVAAGVPARKAARVDPVIALRTE